jgi:prepilin-type processing-associated H-X9-DG protein
VIQFGELAEINPDETTNIAGGDHLHVDQFYLAIAPQITILRINSQMPLGRHGGKPISWDAILNFGFLDGHAESLTIRQVYTNPDRNQFDPLAAN